LKVFPTCGQDAISAIVDLASETFSRKAHPTRKGKKEGSRPEASVEEEGGSVPQDKADALKYRRAADKGDASAQFNLGVRYHDGRRVPQYDTEAVKWFRRAADQGDATAKFNLAGMYAEGRGVPQDDTEMMKWLRRAADQGIAAAEYTLGVMHAEGRGVPQDDAEAVKWYRRAAGQGDTDA
jgi:TPR repeat protein